MIVPVADEPRSAQVTLHPVGQETRVDSDTGGDPALDEESHEVALAASDLQHRSTFQGVPLHELPGEIPGERLELAGEGLTLLRGLGVVDQFRIESDVLDEPTLVAQCQHQIARRVGQGLAFGVQEDTTLGGNGVDLVEALHPDSPAHGANGCERRFPGFLGERSDVSLRQRQRIVGSGTGTTNLPPPWANASCWAMISSLKFQARMRR